MPATVSKPINVTKSLRPTAISNRFKSGAGAVVAILFVGASVVLVVVKFVVFRALLLGAAVLGPSLSLSSNVEGGEQHSIYFVNQTIGGNLISLNDLCHSIQGHDYFIVIIVVADGHSYR